MLIASAGTVKIIRASRFAVPQLTNPEIEDIERTLGHKLPRLYHTLLFHLGFGQVGPNAEIYHPLAIRDLYAPFIDDPGELFNPYFPFGCQHIKQELWVIDAEAEKAASIWHETVPGDWPDEEWLPYEDWIPKYLLDPQVPGTGGEFSRS
jgi:hypothetical protein